MFNIRQTSTVEYYMERFSELFDQLTAYEPNLSQVHYATRFMEGLVPSVRLLVGIQQPADLDAAYALALLSEELGDHSFQPTVSVSSASHNRKNFQPFARSVIVSKAVEDKHAAETSRPAPIEDR